MWGQQPAPTPSSRPGPGAASFAQAVSSNGQGPSASSSQPSSLDINDFPALGSVGQQHAMSRSNTQSPKPTSSTTTTTTTAAAPSTSNISQPPGLQQYNQQQNLQRQQEVEDYPALPGSASTTAVTTPSISAATNLASSANTSTANNTAVGGNFTKKSSEELEKYGMNGLTSVVRMESNDQTTVAIGSELNQLGLTFNSDGQPLSATFSSPWVGTSKHKTEPEFELPTCYNVPSAMPQQQKIQNLTEETLFYIFYTMPRDSMQEAAAQELMNRNWRYHKELQLWLTKDPRSEPVQQANQAERGYYIFFDPSHWEKVKKEYVLRYADIA